VHNVAVFCCRLGWQAIQRSRMWIHFGSAW